MKNNYFELGFQHFHSTDAGQAWMNADDLLAAAENGDYKKADPCALAAFLSDALRHINKDGLFSPNAELEEGMPHDARVGILYQPSYVLSAGAVYLKTAHPEHMDDGLWSSSVALMDAAFARGVAGHGFDAAELKCKVMLMMYSAGVTQLPETVCPYPAAMMRLVTEYTQQHIRLAEEIAWGKNRAGQNLYFGDFARTKANEYIRQAAAAGSGKANTIFVYGTLMRGERMHRLLDGSVYLGRFILDGFHLYDLGSFPGILRNGNSYGAKGRVPGEVYCVDEDTLRKLDAYESEGELYTRETVKVRSEFGSIRAMVYTYNGSVDTGSELKEWRAETDETDYVWYAAYGSNLSEERFRCYLQGGTCEENGRTYPGCADKSEWLATTTDVFRGRMYFGNHSASCNDGGVAFFDETSSERVHMRLYKITRAQLRDVQAQESDSSNWYGRTVLLGYHDDACPIYTLTSATRREVSAPDPVYLDLIRRALEEELRLSKRETASYLKLCQKALEP